MSDLFKAAILSLVVFVAAVERAPTLRAFSAQASTAASCSAPEYRRFDFWAGDWDVFEVGSPVKSAHARVDRELEGCVLHERYEGANGAKGQSFTIYDASRKVWHQTWVTDRGELLVIEGQFQDGEMVLSGIEQMRDGKAKHVRGTWKSVKGEVRETAVTSIDGGETWQPWFDLIFRPRAKGRT